MLVISPILLLSEEPQKKIDETRNQAAKSPFYCLKQSKGLVFDLSDFENTTTSHQVPND